MINETCGYVYILSNPAMPGILKIGRSINGGRSRANDLYKQGGTGVPMPFKMEFEIWSDNCFSSESYIHEELRFCRINESREFFRIELNEAIRVLMSVIGSDYNLTTGHTDFTVTENDMMISYGEMSLDITQELSPGVPIGLVLTNAIAYHLDINSVNEAINSYKAACEKRRLLMESRKDIEPTSVTH